MIAQLCTGYARQNEDHISRVDDRLLTRVLENGKFLSYEGERMVILCNVAEARETRNTNVT